MRALAADWLRRIFRSAPGVSAEETRWVILDCESSGLDPRSDSLLAIGAVALQDGRIALDSGFSVVLRQDAPSEPSNIVIHGVSGGQQMEGVESVDALRAFADYAGEALLVAFHASFDQELLGRALRGAGMKMRNRWLDLAALAPALHPERARRCKALDDWLEAFGIENPARHAALADAYATAQLFQVLLAGAREQGAHTGTDIFRAAAAGRWLAGGR